MRHCCVLGKGRSSVRARSRTCAIQSTYTPSSPSLRGQIEGYIYIKDKEPKENKEASALTSERYNAKQHCNINNYTSIQSHYIISSASQCFLYNFAAGSNKCFISEFGYSTFSDESGRCRSHAHFSINSGANSPSSICVMYFPSTGKNLYPWNEPQVAMYSPLEAE